MNAKLSKRRWQRRRSLRSALQRPTVHVFVRKSTPHVAPGLYHRCVFLRALILPVAGHVFSPTRVLRIRWGWLIAERGS